MTLYPASSAIDVTGREGSACAFAPGLLTAYWQYNETVNSIMTGIRNLKMTSDDDLPSNVFAHRTNDKNS